MHADFANLCRQSVTSIAFTELALAIQGYNGTNGLDGINGTMGACAYYLVEVHDAPLRGWLLLKCLGSAVFCIVHHPHQTCRILVAYSHMSMPSYDLQAPQEPRVLLVCIASKSSLILCAKMLLEQ